MSEIWAKSSERASSTPVRLSEHIKDLLEVFDHLKEHVESDLREIIKLAIICHDFGKVLPAFQIRALKNKSYEPSYPYYNVPHSLFSVLWIDLDKLREHIKDSEQDQEDYLRFVLSAVAYHHWREEFIEWLSNRKLGDLCRELESKGYITRLQENLIEEIKKLNEDWHTLICFNSEMAKGLQNGVPLVEYARPPYQLYWLPKRVDIDESKLRDWILISGFLLRSDHFASFCEEEGEKYKLEDQNVSLNVIKQNVKSRIEEKAKTMGAKSIWQLEKLEDLRDQNVVLVAPTGYGKTEFAFLWSSSEKFFYTLPLRAAVNQIFERAKQIFQDQSGDEKVGLLHSDADVYLLGDGGEAQASLKSYDLARQLAHPVLIATGDQFFPYAVRPPGYEKIYATFSYSRLVIDEVQAYDPRAAAIIVKFIEDIVHMGGKFLLMTATLPQFVKDEIDRVIGQQNYKLLNVYQEEKDKFERLTKHRLKVELIENAADESKPDFTVPKDKLSEILKTAKEAKRVLVIANTVKQAQEIFSKLKELIEGSADYQTLRNKLWLLHSRFTQTHRSELETKLVEEFKNPKPNNENEGKILVATQVVEASLDIDTDVLFTEIAPLDALVQRMGRVWRRYGPLKKPEEIPEILSPNVYIWVFKHGLQSGRHYVYDNDLVLLTLKLLRDKSSNQLKEDYRDWLVGKRKDHPQAEERIEAVIEEVFGSQEDPQKKVRGRKRDKSEDVNPVAVPGSREFQVTLSEYDKFTLVETLYDLPDDHSYLTKFRQTKDILDAGYMSDQLNDAQKMFREIYTIPVIPSQHKNRFMEEVVNFFKKHSDEKRLYTLFKKEVLTKFVVAIPLIHVVKEEGRDHQPVEWWVRDLPDLCDEQRKRLIRWCRDIYFADYEYVYPKGLLVSTSWHNPEIGII